MKHPRIEASRKSQEELWSMTKDQFNDWRKKDDFPRILEFFQKRLAGFKDWQAEFQLKDSDLIDRGISEFLILEDRFSPAHEGPSKYLAKITSSKGTRRTFISTSPFEVGHTYRGESEGETNTIADSIEFEPYVLWVSKKRIKIHEKAFNNHLDVTSIHGVHSPEYCRTYFLDELELLKLGGIKSGRTIDLSERMLQFTNLDFMNFEGIRFDSSYGKQLSFSSARHWHISSSELHFYYLTDCNLERLTVESSILDNWHFIRCKGRDVKITNSRLMRCLFGLGNFVPYFDNVDLTDTELVDRYDKLSGFGFEPISDLPRRMKVAFRAHGQDQQAGTCFYLERTIEKRNALSRGFRILLVYLFPNELPRRLWELWNMRKESRMKIKAFVAFTRAIFKQPGQRKHHSSQLRNAFIDFVSYLALFIQEKWWGYGEKPVRVIAISILLIVACSICIHFAHTIGTDGTLLDSFYYSVVSFLTIGDSSFEPQGLTRAIVALEALLGILNLGFLIGGLANKSRY